MLKLIHEYPRNEPFVQHTRTKFIQADKLMNEMLTDNNFHILPSEKTAYAVAAEIGSQLHENNRTPDLSSAIEYNFPYFAWGEVRSYLYVL